MLTPLIVAPPFTTVLPRVVRAAGGRVVDVSLNDLLYNTKESILNPFFYVIGDPAFDWEKLLSQVDI